MSQPLDESAKRALKILGARFAEKRSADSHKAGAAAEDMGISAKQHYSDAEQWNRLAKKYRKGTGTKTVDGADLAHRQTSKHIDKKYGLKSRKEAGTVKRYGVHVRAEDTELQTLNEFLGEGRIKVDLGHVTFAKGGEHYKVTKVHKAECPKAGRHNLKRGDVLTDHEFGEFQDAGFKASVNDYTGTGPKK